MKTWVGHNCFYKWSLQYLATLTKKVFKKITGTWCYHEFKEPVLLMKHEKTQMYISTGKNL